MQLGNKIRQLRENEHLTRKELAEKIGITYHALAKYEINEREPDYSTLKKMADYFQVSTDYLLGAITSKPAKNIHPSDPVDLTLYETLQPTLEDRIFQKRKILFDKSAKVSEKDLEKFIKMMDIMAEEDEEDF